MRFRAGSQRLPIHRVGVAALTILLPLGASLARPPALTAQSGGEWKRDWSVRCTWTHRLLLEAVTKLAATLFPDLLPVAELEAIADEVCSDYGYGEESLFLHDAGFSRTEFRASSHWLRELGFPAPIVKPAPDDRKYLAWLDNHLFRRRDRLGQVVTDASGRVVVDANGLYFGGGDIFLSPPLVSLKAAVEPHELFHGVQNAAAPDIFALSPDDQWVWEGTARAVDLAWAAKPNTPAHSVRSDRRFFDDPLHLIPSDSERGPAYGTSIFWLDAGRQLRADDRVGYLPEVLDRMPSVSSSLQAVDEALSDLFRARGESEGGLYRAFPEFVRYRLSRPHEGILQFRAHREDQVTLPGPGSVEATVPALIEPLAANAHRIRVTVPDGLVAGLRIEFEQSDSYLHLIVDGRRLNRFPTADRPGRNRNVFTTAIEGTGRDTLFYVRVANVDRPASATQRRSYALKISLEALERCDSDVMMYALHPRARDLVPILQPAERYEAEYEAEPGLHPAPGSLRISGVVSDEGDACTEPLGTNPLLGFQSGDGSARERFRAAAERLMSLSPEQLMKAVQSLDPDAASSVLESMLPGLSGDAARQATGLFLESMGEDGDALLSLYSPNGLAWQAGTPVHPLSIQRLLEHSGIGGWAPNAGAGLTLRLPGVSPGQLAEGRTYPAELAEAMTSVGTPVYSRWSGREFTARCQGVEMTLLDGWTEWVTADALSGEVTVTRITGAAVHGTFSLRGTGRAEKEEFRRSSAGGCATVESSGPQVRTGGLTIEGAFTAPNVAETRRLGRAVALTGAAEPDPEDDGDITPGLAVYPPALDDREKPFCGRNALNFGLCTCLLYTVVRTIGDPQPSTLAACVCDLPGVSSVGPCAPDPDRIDLPEPPPRRDDRTVIPPPCTNPADCPPPPTEEDDPCPEEGDCPPPPDRETCEERGDCPEPDPDPPPPRRCTPGVDCPEEDPEDPGPPGRGPDPGDSPTPEDTPDRSPGPAPSGSGSGEAFELPGARWLAFEDAPAADLKSPRQPVEGLAAGAPGEVRVRGERYRLRFALEAQEVSGCGVPGMLGPMLAGGQDLTASVDLTLSAARDHVVLTLQEAGGQGTIRLEAGGGAGGRVVASVGADGRLRVSATDGRFSLTAQGTRVTCEGVADFVAALWLFE